jgi:sRNA-binding protein
MDWPFWYAMGVLGGWKISKAYCRAVLCTERRIGLDGSPAEPVDDGARQLAKAQLDRYAAKAAAKAAEQPAPKTLPPEQIAPPSPQAPAPEPVKPAPSAAAVMMANYAAARRRLGAPPRKAPVRKATR